MSESEACEVCGSAGLHENHHVCPRCESSGFDGQGQVLVGDTMMYQKRCWNCGLTFAVEVEDV